MQKNNQSLATKNNQFSDKEWTVSANDIYLDLAILTCDCFRAKLVRDDDGLKILFDNGQKFIVDVKEI